MNTESRLFFRKRSVAVADRLRGLTPRVRHSSPALCRAGHAPWTSWRRSRVLKPPQRLPTESLLHLHFLRAQRRVRGHPPLLRLRPACSALQKHDGHPARSLAVIPSATPTPWAGRLCLGKDEIAISSIAAMAGPRRSWRSTRPTTTADFPSPPLCSASLVVNSGSSSPA